MKKLIKKIFGVCSESLHREIFFNRVAVYTLFFVIGILMALIVAQEKEIKYLHNKIERMDSRIEILSENIQFYLDIQGIKK